MSLKDILNRQDHDIGQNENERYILLSNIVDAEGDRSDNNDRQLVVTRTRMDFNNKSCRLISFTDISFVEKLKLFEETTQVYEMEQSFIKNKVIGKIDESLQSTRELWGLVDSKELREVVNYIYN